jgi:hypothetical protein
MTKRQKRGKYRDNPMVSVDPVLLKAAVESRGLSLADIAKRLSPTENRQTIHAMMRGEQHKRCRRARRVRLAQILEVPEDWLSGELLRELSAARWWAPLVVLFGMALGSPRVVLAVLRLQGSIDKAAKRDGIDETLIDTVPGIASPSAWRATLLRGPGGTAWKEPERSTGEGISGLLRAVQVPRDEEEATLNLVRGLSFALEPWFEGRATLAPDQLTLLASTLGENPETRHPPKRSGRKR